MRKLPLLLALLFSLYSYSQSNDLGIQDVDSNSPYELNWAVDGPWLGASLGLTGYGFHLIQNKNPLTEEDLASLSKDDIFILDRWIAGNSSKNADELSYIPFYASFGMPLLLLINKNERQHAGQLAVIYLETMATTGALYTIAAGAVDRSRPQVYDTSLPLNERTGKSVQRSFFGGHVAATGAATFFFAKVFHDFHPDSWAKPYIWTAAAVVPAWVGYLRIKSGKHFLTDTILGYAVGALSGILIPEFHKREKSNFDLSPSLGVDLSGFDYQGISFKYKF